VPPGGCFPGGENQGRVLVHPPHLVLRSKLDATRTPLLYAYMAECTVNLLISTMTQATAPSKPRSPHSRGFTITLRHTTVSRTPVNERSARRRDLYLTTHNTQKRLTSMPPPGFELAIPGNKRPQTHFLDRAATGIG